MKKDYTELINSLKVLIESFDKAKEEFKDRIDKIETSALNVFDAIDTSFAKDVVSGRNPEVQGLYDELRNMFYELCDEDEENKEFGCLLMASINDDLDKWKDSFAGLLKDLEGENSQITIFETENKLEV